MSKRGYTERNIALVANRPLKTVNRIIQAYRDEGGINDPPHRRRPRSTTNDQHLCIVAGVNDESFQRAKNVRGALGPANLSDNMVRRRLREAGLRTRIAAQKPLLTAANKAALLRFATEHRSWSESE
ncbi:hypothetical protein HPB48_025804 [Haemaphysalis longicornis]|uniref:Transposase Tc1-like domain-containing protein n=1 Tax=Haemaphysalis longicornis TaxID=44386 RepID=A0A9J6HAL2_HAELO|nr:hypothetical protein HPB48_025804 [Haemaphysalis longicornis]